ncbi:MAG: response regulator [Elusimicrobiaceae bacterium]
MKKVLIADDEAVTRLTLAAALGKRFEILSAKNGIEALAMARQEKPDLILLDINMPAMDGLETLARLKAEKTNFAIIIMLTGENDLETADKALALGACEYVTKPFDAEKIRNLVECKLDSCQHDAPWKVNE